MTNWGTIMPGMLKDCVLLHETSSDGGLLGTVTTWTEGAKFKAMVVKRNSMEQKIAERRDVSEIFDVTVETGVPLKYNSVFRTLSDGQVYRVTGNPSVAPPASTVQISSMSAEKWVIPT